MNPTVDSMPHRLVHALLVAAMLVAAPTPAMAASGASTFDKTPMAKFGKDDVALMMAKVNLALAAEKDGETLEWKSDTSPASGSVTPLARFSADGMSCRRLRIVNVFADYKAQGVYRFCQKPAGKWKLIGPDSAPA